MANVAETEDVVDWFRKPEIAIVMEEESPKTSRDQEEICVEIQEDGVKVTVIREERMSRMERRRREWEGRMFSKKIILELLDGVEQRIVMASVEEIIKRLLKEGKI